MTILSEWVGNTAATLEIFLFVITSTNAKRLLQRCICFSVSTIEKRMVAVEGKRSLKYLVNKGKQEHLKTSRLEDFRHQTGAEQRKKNTLHDCINELQRCKRNSLTKHKNEYGAFALEEKDCCRKRILLGVDFGDIMRGRNNRGGICHEERNNTGQSDG